MPQVFPPSDPQEMLKNLTTDYDYLAHPGLMTNEQVQVPCQRAFVAVGGRNDEAGVLVGYGWLWWEQVGFDVES